MKIAFLTEMGFIGKIPETHPNMRVEFSWMFALDAEHININMFADVKGYDHVFIIFPKGTTFLNSAAVNLIKGVNPVSELLSANIVQILKQSNNKVHYVQEGPHWWWNDYEMVDQVNFYNLLSECDTIFAHNEYDVKYYKGMFPSKPVNSIYSLMIDTLIKDIIPIKQDKVIIGGNFARWYSGFESYIAASDFLLPIWAQTSHATRDGEEQVPGLNHLPRMSWVDWMKELSTFKYAVHLMPTVAAGTFSLNCAYFGIPCIGNVNVDTQRICHPLLSIDVADVTSARNLVTKLKTDKDFYDECSSIALENYDEFYNINVWKDRINTLLL